MSFVKSILIITIIGCLWAGCKDKSDSTEFEEVTTKNLPVTAATIVGRYVSDSYELRGEGYDWVSVNIGKISEDEIFLKVRSRADRKKPTCTFDVNAFRVNDSLYATTVQGKLINIKFSAHSVTILGESSEDEAALYFYCNGGATVAGTYHKIYDAIDTAQLDKTTFSKDLQLQDIGFSVSAKPINGTQQDLVIFPYGLELPDQAITRTIDGIVVDAEIEDLDSDGFPEIVVYTQSGPHKKGDVIACSVLKKRSMILMYFPPIAENVKISKGYEGYDTFSLVETNLIHRFPLYEKGQATGKMRQISYQLQNGESTKVFRINDVIEIDSN